MKNLIVSLPNKSSRSQMLFKIGVLKYYCSIPCTVILLYRIFKLHVLNSFQMLYQSTKIPITQKIFYDFIYIQTKCIFLFERIWINQCSPVKYSFHQCASAIIIKEINNSCLLRNSVIILLISSEDTSMKLRINSSYFYMLTILIDFVLVIKIGYWISNAKFQNVKLEKVSHS